MKYIAIILLVFFAISCNVKKEKTIESPNGIWKQDGYGKVVEIQDSIIKVYNICKIDCHLAFEEEVLDFGRIKKVIGDTLIIKHNIDDWKFHRINVLPKLCLDTKIENSKDPIHNFDVFWHTFKENYASFEIKNIDWDKIYEKYRSQISKETSNVELYSAFKEMTDLLNDGHIGLDVPSKIEDEFKKSQIKTQKRYSTLDVFKINKEIANLYVDSLRNYNGGFVRWGMIEEEVGYIQFNAMWMIGNYNIDPELGMMKTYELYVENVKNKKDEETRDDEEKGADYIMNKIFNDLSNAKSYILDLRFNGGGKDAVAMQIMNRFAQKKKKVVTKYVKYNDSYTAYQNIYVNPSDSNFSGELIILTSHFTASAAELAVLASLPNPNIKRIGSKTEGIFSSTLDKSLPNGWTYELSNEIYTDLDGANYENIGIPPNISVNYSTDKDVFLDKLKDGITKEKDEAIEMALKVIIKK